MALPGLLWLGWVSMGACQTCAYASLPPRRSVDKNPTQDTIYTLAWVLVNLLATCDLSRAKGVVKEINLPLGGVLVLLSLSRHLHFGPNTAYSARLRVGICRGRNGRIMDESTQKRSDDTKIRQMTAYNFSETTHLSRIRLCIRSTFL